MQDVTASDVFASPVVARLAAAAASGDVDQVRRLAAEGADVNAHGDKGVTPLLWALVHRSTSGMAALLSVGAQVSAADAQGVNPMQLAAGADDPALLDTLLAHGASPDTRDPVRGRTPIFDAILGDRQAQFEQLLSIADLDAADQLGNRPLHTAASIGDYARVLQLLQSGASPDATNGRGDTFLQMLPQGGNLSSAASEQARTSRAALVAWLHAHAIAPVPGLLSAD